MEQTNFTTLIKLQMISTVKWIAGEHVGKLRPNLTETQKYRFHIPGKQARKIIRFLIKTQLQLDLLRVSHHEKTEILINFPHVYQCFSFCWCSNSNQLPIFSSFRNNLNWTANARIASKVNMDSLESIDGHFNSSMSILFLCPRL